MRITEDRVREIVTEMLDGFTFRTDGPALAELEGRVERILKWATSEFQRYADSYNALTEAIEELTPAGLTQARQNIVNLKESLALADAEPEND